ncbi:MAG: hypothetical protein GWO23_08890, partial [Gammaproteobacteria bacterium]|nr:hypothetical protein [Gammaproteobacteria bacterium]
MAVTNGTAPSFNSEMMTVLKNSEVLSAITELLPADRPVADRLKEEISFLLKTANWSGETSVLAQSHFAAKHTSGPLRDVLQLPGNFVLLRNDDQYAILQYVEKRWTSLNRRGEIVSDNIDSQSEDLVDAVVMTLPPKSSAIGGFSSLVALWPELRAAWAEVGVASLFINFGQLLLPLFALL